MAEPCSNVRIPLRFTQLLAFGSTASQRRLELLSFLGKGMDPTEQGFDSFLEKGMLQDQNWGVGGPFEIVRES